MELVWHLTVCFPLLQFHKPVGGKHPPSQPWPPHPTTAQEVPCQANVLSSDNDLYTALKMLQ